MVKEVNEAAEEFLGVRDFIPNGEEELTISSNNITNSTFCLNLKQV